MPNFSNSFLFLFFLIEKRIFIPVEIVLIKICHEFFLHSYIRQYDFDFFFFSSLSLRLSFLVISSIHIRVSSVRRNEDFQTNSVYFLTYVTLIHRYTYTFYTHTECEQTHLHIFRIR